MKQRQPKLSLYRREYPYASWLRLLLLLFLGGLAVSQITPNPLDRLQRRQRQSPPSWGPGQQSERDGHFISRSLGESCAFGCNESSSCDATCQSAFAYCNQGGSSSQTCITELGVDDNSVGFGWTNHVNCTGGMILCELWIGSMGCNTSTLTSRRIGNMVVDTNSSTLEFGLTDASHSVAAVHVYVGTTSIPLVNETSYISPNHYNSMSWYYPPVTRAAIYMEPRIEEAVYLIAHAYVCPSDSSVPPSPAPSIAATQSNMHAIRECPIQAGSNSPILPVVSPFASPLIPIATPDSRDNPSRFLQWDSVLCPFRCDDALLSCDSRCKSAFAFCADLAPTCLSNETADYLGKGSTSPEWGWLNPVTCHGGSIECELWIGASDCRFNQSGSSLVGTVVVNTDANALTYHVSVPNYAISSLQVIRGDSQQSMVMNEQDSSPQNVWFHPNAIESTVYLPSAVRPGSVLVAHANLCPVDNTTSSERSLYVEYDPSSTIQPATCPIQPSVPPTVSPTTPTSIAPAEAASKEPTSSTTQATVVPRDTPVDDNQNGDDDDTTSIVDDIDPAGSVATPRPTSCRPSRTSNPSPRPMEFIQLPPNLFRRRTFPDLCSQPSSKSSSKGDSPSQSPKTRRPTSSPYPSVRSRPTASPIPSTSSNPSLHPSTTFKPSASAYPSPMPSSRPSEHPAGSFAPTTQTEAPRSLVPSFNATYHPSQAPLQLTNSQTNVPTSDSATNPTERPPDQATGNPSSAIPTRSTASSLTPPPTNEASNDLHDTPTGEPMYQPTLTPTNKPSKNPVSQPSPTPTLQPIKEVAPTTEPTADPTAGLTAKPTEKPTAEPTVKPTDKEKTSPTRVPSR